MLDLGLGHVHELQADPASDAVFAATHYGLWRLPPGEAPQRVGDSARDVMGFAVADPGTFLGSGHPDPRDGGPGNVGLIRSTDEGLTWDTVALGGEVDFHALSTTEDSVYGWDATSGTVLASSDAGETFTAGAQLAVVDLLADPTEASVVLAATDDGLQRSTDRGDNFTPLSLQPPSPLTHLAYSGTDGDVLVGIDVAGAVWVLGPDGWQSPGALPAPGPVAFTAAADQLWAATTDAVLTSTDGGATWTSLASLG